MWEMVLSNIFLKNSNCFCSLVVGLFQIFGWIMIPFKSVLNWLRLVDFEAPYMVNSLDSGISSHYNTRLRWYWRKASHLLNFKNPLGFWQIGISTLLKQIPPFSALVLFRTSLRLEWLSGRVRDLLVLVHRGAALCSSSTIARGARKASLRNSRNWNESFYLNPFCRMEWIRSHQNRILLPFGLETFCHYAPSKHKVFWRLSSQRGSKRWTLVAASKSNSVISTYEPDEIQW